MKVLVTGGTGFLGKALQKVRPDWKYLGSDDGDLSDYTTCCSLIEDFKPDAIVHLAAVVGGIKYNINNPDFIYQKNLAINNNIVLAAQRLRVKRLLGALSTCMFPDKADRYPLKESALLEGTPPSTNLGYALSKRAMLMCTQWVRSAMGYNYSCFAPCNLYGPRDYYGDDLSNLHFLDSAIFKIAHAEPESWVEFWGSGREMRQFVLTEDVARLIPRLLETSEPVVNIAPDWNKSIRDIVSALICIAKKPYLKETFNGKMPGQYRKDADNALLRRLFPDFEFTSFTEGLEKAYGNSNYYRSDGTDRVSPR